MKRTILSMAVILAVVGMVPRMSGAAILNSHLNLSGPGPYLQLVTDKDAEELIKAPGNLLPGVIQVGDILESIMEFQDINSLNFSTEIGVDYELTVHSRLKVLSITAAVLRNPDGTVFDSDLITPGIQSIALPGGGSDFVFGSGFADGVTTARLYESQTSVTAVAPNFARDDLGAGLPINAIVDLTIPAAVATATDGTLITEFGFGDVDDFWVSFNSPTILSVFTATSSEVSGAVFSFGQSVTSNPGALNIVDNATASSIFGGTHGLVGSGRLFGVLGAETPFDAYTSTSANFTSAVPEPSSLVAWGVLVGGVCGVRRRVYFRGRTNS